MCDFCIQHGEGKKWYLQAKNYSLELLNCERLRYVFSCAKNIERWSTDWASELDRIIFRYCFGVTTSIPLFRNFCELYPDFSSDLEVLTKEKAKKTFQEHDHDGLVHTVWTFITPFIAVICNCNSKDCLPLKWRLHDGLNLFFKGEYVARVDWDKCIGCRDCMKSCNFGAISHSTSMDKCQVNQFQCYGCGVCRAICPYEAITLHDRNAIPPLAKEW